MKSKARIVRVTILSLLTIGVMSNPGLKVAGSRQLACVLESGDPQVLDMNAFPIQPGIFTRLEPDTSTSVSYFYSLLTQADQGYLNEMQQMSNTFVSPLPDMSLSAVGYLVGSPWSNMPGTAVSPVFNSAPVNSSFAAVTNVGPKKVSIF